MMTDCVPTPRGRALRPLSSAYRVHLPVTVLMTVYNGREYLREAVQSILDQSFTDFEFLIINDGSTDDSLKILNQYAQRDSRIRIVSRANRGLTVTLNEGIAIARGEFIARMDADDIAMPDRLEKQLAYLRAHPDCVLLGSRVMLVDPKGSPIEEICRQTTHEEIDEELISHGWPMVHPAVMIPTSALRDIGGYCELYRTNQDHDLFLRLAEYGRVANLPDVLLKYRQHKKSISAANLLQARDPLASILQEACRRRGLAEPVENGSHRQVSASFANHHASWAWAALAAGHVATARKHALAALATMPLSIAAWRMMFCAIRGR